MICPKDMKPCCDDICRGGGCLQYGGTVPGLTTCGGCGQLVPIDGSPDDVFECECECEPEYDMENA